MSEVIHHHAICDGCKTNILKIRYKCMQCKDYDLCSQCKSQGIHDDTEHEYFEIGGQRLCNECGNHMYVKDRTSKLYKCVLCVDYDLCYSCRRNGKHGHHHFICVEWYENGLMIRPSRSPGARQVKGNETSEQVITVRLDAMTFDDRMQNMVRCNGCGQSPIQGIRFKCIQCASYDLCEPCKTNGLHENHFFYPVKTVDGRETQKSALYNPWETGRSSVTIFKNKLGNGKFGTVHKGLWKNNMVAIKTLQKGTLHDVEAFLREAEIMGKLKHNNILPLLAVVTREEPILIITEFMNQGSLYRYLKRNKKQLQVPTLIWIMTEVADGMQYLESKDLVHRDLAARNVLVGKDIAARTLMIKICDFGLTRLLSPSPSCDSLVYESTSGLFPIRWTAPEAMPPENKFTVLSDVWSFGILLTEIITFGRCPYANVKNNNVVCCFVKMGKVIPKEDLADCPDGLYELMKSTWIMKADDRPRFKDIVRLLHVCFDETMQQITAKINAHPPQLRSHINVANSNKRFGTGTTFTQV